MRTLRFCAAVLFFSVVTAMAQTFDPPLQMIVKVPVADIRAEQKPADGTYRYDPLQETQVTKGDPVTVLERQGEWARVEAAEQPEYTHHDRWEGYPGWIKWNSLSSDLKLYRGLVKVQAPEEELRKKLLEKASLHLGNPYLWGGRSLHDEKIKSVATGVDCSGLVNWSFRELGRIVPRDAHEQYMKAQPVSPADLKPGDLVFLANAQKPGKIVHVAIFAGGDNLIEGPQSGEKVRRITFKEKFGKSRTELSQKETLGDRVVYFGTLFTEGR